MIKTYLFFGNIGAGKGTQVQFLKKYIEEKQNKKVIHVYPGQAFREFISKEGFTNERARDLMHKGFLMPLFLVSGVFYKAVVDGLSSENDVVLVDGFPRAVEQIPVFETFLKFYNISENEVEVIYLDISKEEAIRRLALRSRHDDTPEGIAQRFEEYENRVLPTLSLLKEKGFKIHNLNGEQSIDLVSEELLKMLNL